MKAEEIAKSAGRKVSRTYGIELACEDIGNVDVYDDFADQVAKATVKALREAGLLLEWRTDMENAPRDRAIMLHIPDWPNPRKVHTGEFHATELTPAGWLVHGGVNLSARWNPTAWAEIPSIKPPEQTND